MTTQCIISQADNDSSSRLTQQKFIFATAGKRALKSEPMTSSSVDRSLFRKLLVRHWGREERFCLYKKETFPQRRALYLLRKKEESPICMRNFGRFVAHANDWYALQYRKLIQRFSDRMQRQMNLRLHFFEQWRHARNIQSTLKFAGCQVRRSRKARLGSESSPILGVRQHRDPRRRPSFNFRLGMPGRVRPGLSSHSDQHRDCSTVQVTRLIISES
jgi:hypothetical protein